MGQSNRPRPEATPARPHGPGRLAMLQKGQGGGASGGPGSAAPKPAPGPAPARPRRALRRAWEQGINWPERCQLDLAARASCRC